jgi:hypothetical protein
VQAFYSEKNAKYNKGRFQWDIDCAKKRLQGVTAEVLKKDGTSVKISKSSEWSPIPAGSTAESLYEKVCPQKDGKKPKE